MTFTTIILVATATATALIAGLFYAYSCSVNLGLARLPDAAYIAAMQSINRAILNPVFLFSFMGTLVLLPISTYLHYGDQLSLRFILLMIASLLYITSVFGVTIFGNVPLNDVLAGFDLQSASLENIAQERLKFEKPWNKLHTIRTLASIVSLVLVLVACVADSRLLHLNR